MAKRESKPGLLLMQLQARFKSPQLLSTHPGSRKRVARDLGWLNLLLATVASCDSVRVQQGPPCPSSRPSKPTAPPMLDGRQQHVTTWRNVLWVKSTMRPP
jgi:hypothetical protein